MGNTIPPGLNKQSTSLEQWQRVAAELRKRRDEQRAYFGTVPDITVGRYISGEATAEERAEVEAQMETHPGLKETIKAIREVLK